MQRALVITTINKPNNILKNIAFEAAKRGIHFIIIGDTKTPKDFKIAGADYYSIERQRTLFPQFSESLPLCHYSRKNIGYLVAYKEGADIIQETDDDNIPYKEFWDDIPDEYNVDFIKSPGSWFNVYKLFSDEHIWPRGFPLQLIKTTNNLNNVSLHAGKAKGLIIQGLADGNPDVDAIYRLVFNLPIKFKKRKPIMLHTGNWCPFNSQNTIFKKEVFPLLYLPSFCNFRATDIWRSFIAQRCLWELGEGIVFQSSTVVQERNEHNLLRDFEEEINGYLYNDKIRAILENCILDRFDQVGNLIKCYDALVTKEIFPDNELKLVMTWALAIEKIWQ